MPIRSFDISTPGEARITLRIIVIQAGNRNIMNPTFVRLGLPWLIFGSAMFTLYWTIWHGEIAVSIPPTEIFAQHSLQAQPAGRSDALIGKDPHATFQTSGQPISGTTVARPSAPVKSRERQTPAPRLPMTDDSEKFTAEQDPYLIASHVHTALQDPDPNKRFRALQESEARGIAVPAHILQQLATSDRDGPVRILAMTKFAQGAEIDPAMVRAVAEAGLRDGDETVNAYARDMLEQLDRASRSNDETPQLLPGDPTVD